jgi:hypothetical protein
MATTEGGTNVGPPCAAPGGAGAGQPSILKLCLGGFAGTVALVLIMFLLEPVFMGRSPDLARALGTEISNPHGLGLIVFHFFDGSVVFPLGFGFLAARVRAPWLVKGLIWGIMLWVLAGAVLMPMSGSGFFGYNADGLRVAASSLAAHLAYGGLQGFIAGIPTREED